ncbi:MAG: class I SAM-dependent methyltransferase [Rhizobiales bacterium]|nr:class I SAM-dependent methyltransferase [Hyphomicrobiales bacterium]
MTASDTTEQRVAPGVLLGVFASAIFLSAVLLFVVQPLFTKMVLPRLGGSPSVWSVAMVFFQAALLAGYTYAHGLTRFMPTRLAVPVHVALLIVATFALPLAIVESWGRPPSEGATGWLLGLFAVSIGLPFFALSANGPLLQAWFARTGHPAAKDPYFLYAASNVGSFLALISYPLLIEPFTTLGEQTKVWSAGFYLLIVLIAASGVLLLRSPNALPARTEGASDEAAPTWRDVAIWVALAAVPSALLIAVTAHISTDVAAAPLLWVVPLALYLATFVIVFQTKPVLPHRWMVVAQPFAIVALVAVLAINVLTHLVLTLSLNILAFFLCAMVCHGELARRRPTPRYLTAFYMWMSAGGMLGGISAGLIAPHVFSWVAEYPLLIVLAILCRPGLAWPRERSDAWWWLLIPAATLAIVVPKLVFQYTPDANAYWIAIVVLLSFAFVLQRQALLFGAFIALTFVLANLYGTDGSRRATVRSFFGVHKIVDSEDGMFRVLLHGTTEHGAQQIRDEDGLPLTGRPEPLTYYHADSPLARGIAAARARKNGPLRVGAVGLGTGSLACYVEPGDRWQFYEIDPSVVRIARDPARFTYLARCAPDVPIVLGDARLTLADAADASYDVLVIDAFSSDAIPVHLLTREAMAIYLQKLAPGGMVLVHVSNRHMELATVVAGIAEANGLVTRVIDSDEGDDDENHKFSSNVAAAARADTDFGALAQSDDWQLEEADPDQRVWTDDYSNIVGAIVRKMRE